VFVVVAVKKKSVLLVPVISPPITIHTPPTPTHTHIMLSYIYVYI